MFVVASGGTSSPGSAVHRERRPRRRRRHAAIGQDGSGARARPRESGTSVGYRLEDGPAV